MARCALFIALLLLASCVVAQAEPHRLIWASVLQTVHGIRVIRSFERLPFETRKECEEFGDSHVGRMEDWTRGHLRLDWDAPVVVGFECIPVGQPAGASNGG